MDKINTDLAASGVAFKERYNMPVIAEQVQRTLPESCALFCRTSGVLPPAQCRTFPPAV